MGKYVLNLETQKIELHFDKVEYMALSDDLKKSVKSSFLWSSKAGAWVSRSINNHYSAMRVIEKLGLEDGGKIGERLSYAEQLEVKQEKAEARAEKYDQYAASASNRAAMMQSSFNECRKDWSWLTQPIIAGHSGSMAFARQREKIIARYERGFEEYQKSDYYKDRAATARATAGNVKLTDRVYLVKKIKESNKTLKIYQENVVKYEEALYKIQQGEQLKNRSGEVLTEDYIESRISDQLEKYEWEHDKLEFFEKCLDDLGGVQFSKENIKTGYIVEMVRWGKCEIIVAGSVNVTFKILTGGALGCSLTEPYAAITEIIEAKEVKQSIDNPFQVGDILCKFYGMESRNGVYRAWQVIKVTDSGVKLHEIKVDSKVPMKDNFKDCKPVQKKVVKSNFSDFVGVCIDDWRLEKYTQSETAKAI